MRLDEKPTQSKQEYLLPFMNFMKLSSRALSAAKGKSRDLLFMLHISAFTNHTTQPANHISLGDTTVKALPNRGSQRFDLGSVLRFRQPRPGHIRITRTPHHVKGHRTIGRRSEDKIRRRRNRIGKRRPDAFFNARPVRIGLFLSFNRHSSFSWPRGTISPASGKKLQRLIPSSISGWANSAFSPKWS